MGIFERYLTLWVSICILLGISIGYFVEDEIAVINQLEVYNVNVPIALLVWMMIFPMMVQIDFSAIKNISKNSKGLSLTVTMNWLVKPFSMAFFAWLFFDQLYSAWITPEQASQYIAGAILLGAAPCTAMVFVWSYLSKGNPNYTLVQVALNNFILLLLFVPIVGVLLGITDVKIPYETLIISVLIFVVIPLIAGYITNKVLLKRMGERDFKEKFLPRLKPISILALLTTLILLFSFQGARIVEQPFHILLIAIPLTIQTYFIFFITWFIGKKIELTYPICAPAGLIGASNFFELAVAVAIALFGLNSGAAVATVVGVLIEVPIMLSLVAFANKNRY